MFTFHRAQWGVISFLGSGPLVLKMKAKGLLNLFFTKWFRVMLSLSHEYLNFYDKSTSTSPFVSVAISSISAIQVRTGEYVGLSVITLDSKNSGKQADDHDIRINTDTGDCILIR